MVKNIPELIQTYRTEYTRTTGKELFCCSYSHGWFRVGDNTRVRLTEFLKMIDVLKSRPTVTRRVEYVNGIATMIEAHQHVVQNLMTHKDVVEDRDAPNCCSVASETYWAM